MHGRARRREVPDPFSCWADEPLSARALLCCRAVEPGHQALTRFPLARVRALPSSTPRCRPDSSWREVAFNTFLPHRLNSAFVARSICRCTQRGSSRPKRACNRSSNNSTRPSRRPSALSSTSHCSHRSANIASTSSSVLTFSRGMRRNRVNITFTIHAANGGRCRRGCLDLVLLAVRVSRRRRVPTSQRTCRGGWGCSRVDCVVAFRR